MNVRRAHVVTIPKSKQFSDGTLIMHAVGKVRYCTQRIRSNQPRDTHRLRYGVWSRHDASEIKGPFSVGVEAASPVGLGAIVMLDIINACKRDTKLVIDIKRLRQKSGNEPSSSVSQASTTTSFKGFPSVSVTFPSTYKYCAFGLIPFASSMMDPPLGTGQSRKRGMSDCATAAK